MKRACFVVAIALILAGVCFAQAPRQVEVVAEVALTNQTGTTVGTLYTPEEAGMFRVNFYVQCTKGDPNGAGLNPMLTWTDDNGKEVVFYPTIPDGSPGPPASFLSVIKAIAGKPLVWRVTLGNNDTSKYEVYIALERIGPKVQ
jgi:hypothetical protein